jgi:hypothetical protein
LLAVRDSVRTERSAGLVNNEDLKSGLHGDLSQKDKLLLVLAAFKEPCGIRDLKARAADAGLRVSATWNPSARLRQAKGLAIFTPRGWEITDAGRQHLKNLGFGRANPVSIRIATELRSELSRIKNQDTRAFVEEAIKCYEAELYRSAIVMSWLAATDVLYQLVHGGHLDAFNKESVRVDSKWRPAKSVDDLSRMKEGDFLDRLVAISLVGKNVKNELKQCLDRRNGCGHPNSLKIGPATVDHHLEILLLNVFSPFA